MAFRNASAGGGGGGGGSGTFLYSDQGYLLCAGGGGGGSGCSFLTPGGAGGAGGAVGPGAGGGAAGYLKQGEGSLTIMTSSGSTGGNGGGSGRGSGALCSGPTANLNGSDAYALLSSNSPNTTVPGGTGAASYSDSFLAIPESFGIVPLTERNNPYDIPIINILFSPLLFTKSNASGNGGSAAGFSYSSGPYAWLNTNAANGTGAASPPLSATPYSGTLTLRYSEANGVNMNGAGTIIFSNTSVAKGSFDLPLVRAAGRSGISGGNNRSSARGGGAAGGSVRNNLPSNGSEGSVTIYKIY